MGNQSALTLDEQDLGEEKPAYVPVRGHAVRYGDVPGIVESVDKGRRIAWVKLDRDRHSTPLAFVTLTPPLEWQLARERGEGE